MEKKDICRKTVRFTGKEYDLIEQVRKEEGLQDFSKSVSYILQQYVILKKITENKKRQDKAITRIRLASSGADVTGQVIVEILNSICWEYEISDFRGTDRMLHPVVEAAKADVKERIARYKQTKDFREDKKKEAGQ